MMRRLLSCLLLCLCPLMLFAAEAARPKVGLVLSGGAARGLVSLLIENVLAALMAPVTMYVQSRGVAEVLAGRDSGWDAQQRDDGRQTLGDLWRNYRGTTVLGVLMGIGCCT